MRISRVLLLSATLVASCSSAELERRIDEVFAASRTDVRPAGNRLPWAVGQWARYRFTETSSENLFRVFGGETRGFLELAATREEGGAIWIEAHEVLPDEEARFAILMGGVDPERMRDIRPLRLKVLDDDGKVADVEGDARALADASPAVEMMKTLAAVADLRGGTGRIRQVTVPAGTFPEAYVVPVSLPLRTGRRTGNLWFTDSVPIAYLAKFFSRRVSWVWFESTYSLELVDYGPEGAKSYFFAQASSSVESPGGRP